MNENKNIEKKSSFNMKHGSTTYIVNVRFAEKSQTTFGDILKKVVTEDCLGKTA